MLNELYALYDAERWLECAAACESRIGGDYSASTEEWYLARSMLAAVAVKLIDTPKFARLVEAAIKGLEEVVCSGRLPESDERRGMAFRTLGYLYSKRVDGEAGRNNDLSIERYNRALSILDSSTSPQEWAEATVALGNQLLARSRMLTPNEIARDASEVETARESAIAAIAAYERSLAVYEGDGYVDERQATIRQIAAAHEIVDLLNRQLRTLH